MLKVEDRVKQLKLNHVHNIFNNVGPSYLTTNFHRMNERSVRTRRSEFNYCIPEVQGIAAHSFFYTSIKEWNSLPGNIQCTEATTRFKSAVKRHLVECERKVESSDFIFY